MPTFQIREKKDFNLGHETSKFTSPMNVNWGEIIKHLVSVKLLCLDKYGSFKNV